MSFKQFRRPRIKAWRFLEGTYQHRCTATSMRTSVQNPSETLCYPHLYESPSNRLLTRSFSIAGPTRQELGTKSDTRPDSLYVGQEIEKVLDKAHAILASSTVPSETATQAALEACELLARSLTDGVEPITKANTPTLNLLNLEEQRKRNDGSASSTRALIIAMRQRAVDKLSKVAHSIVTTPQVFITPELLSSYVTTQSLLGRPETIPPIFILYASKPIPLPNTSPIQYRSSNPNKASFAVPLFIANTALSSAIERKNLPICFDIINTSVCANAFRRSKFLKRALAPVFGLALAPAAAYSAASQWSLWQDTMDSEMARNVMFAGLLAYVSFTATLGVVAITTANDQMDRVTWVSGTPLRERWLREEERAMVDRVAGAWGFQESWRRGEEEGRDWQTLREWTGLRRMVLDKVELMEGME